jgi:CHASE3 domain sensor protein
MSKGSTLRPFSVAQEQYNERWDLIFGRDKGQKERDKEFDKIQDALDEKAENARQLGLNYD